ncbi:zinc ribbon domain-containing protein [Lactiplantibacillus paraxiangfangensis]|uniref:zinc ribbon domain-containing protein n=1 Tax=Lactiplantibacillus paraxiangfangensis TaxID=3076224 RepID=UPI0030C72FFF
MFETQRTYAAADDHQAGVFCPNCGHSVTAGAKFCQHCGYDLTSVTTSRQTQPKRRVSRWKWITLGIVVVALGGAYGYGRSYFAPDKQLDRAITAIKGNQKTVAQQFTSSDSSLKLSATTLKPLLAHFKTKQADLARFQEQLKNQSFTNDGNFQYVKTGRTWLLFDKYQIQVKPLHVSLTTNHKNVQLSMDGKQVGIADSDDYDQKVGPLVPGDYTLSSSGVVGGHRLKNSATYYLKDNDKSYDLGLRTISFNVIGAPGTVVYLNQQSEGTIGDDGTLAVKDAAWSSNLELTGKYPVGKTMVTSSPTRISDGDADSDVTVDFPSLMSKSDADDYITQLFTAISNYTRSGEIDDATDDNNKALSDYFVDGTANRDYQEFIDMAKGYYKNDDVMSVDYDPSVSLSVPATKGRSQVTYDVKYHFSNTKDDREQVFRYTATIQKNGEDYQIVKISPAQKIRAHTTNTDEDDD